MAGTDPMKPADYRCSGQIKIAHRIEYFVADEFILIAQPVAVEDVVAIDDQDIVERSAAGQPGGAQALDIIGEPEGSRAAQLGLERRRIKAQRQFLAPDQRVFKIDLKAQRKPAIRVKRNRCT